MEQFNVHQAKTQLSRLLEMVENGKRVVIARNGRPIAELVPARKAGLIPGSSKNDPTVDHEAVGGDWWRAMTDEEADEFLEGK